MNFMSASVVSLGCSSVTQCPVSLKTTIDTSDATQSNLLPRQFPFDFSPAITSNGMPSFVSESSAKSPAVFVGRHFSGSWERFPSQGIQGGGSGFLPDRHPIPQCIVGHSVSSLSTLSCQSYVLPQVVGS